MLKLIVFLALGGVRLCCLAPYKAASDAMEPSFPQSRILLVDKNAFGSNSDPRRGDIVVFNYPESNADVMVKRVIGLPGDTIELRNRVLYVNARPVSEYENCGQRTCRRVEKLDGVVYPVIYHSPVVIEPDGQWQSGEGYFVMGDNRSNSYDSRNFGAVSASDMKGRVFAQTDGRVLVFLARALNALLH